MEPWIPNNAIDFKSATAEFWNDLCQRHIEVTGQDFNAKLFYLLDQSIPERNPYLPPLDFHCVNMAMHTHHDDRSSKMAYVLFEANIACEHPCFSCLLMASPSVGRIKVDVVNQEIEATTVVLTSGKQCCRLILLTSHHITMERGSSIYPFAPGASAATAV